MADFVIDALKVSLLVWIGLLAIFVIRDVLLTRRSLRRLLSTGNRRTTDPERVVLLMFTIGFALYYSLTALATPLDELPAPNGLPALPDVPVEVLVILFGTQSSFVLGKILRLYMGARNQWPIPG